MKKRTLLTMLSAFTFYSNSFSQCNNLFFSEYIEGSSSNKALEIYNPSTTSINLTGYAVKIFSNGSATVSNTLNLSGTLKSGEVYVIANSSATLTGITIEKDTNSAVANFNGNDALELSYNGAAIDIIGVIGQDPGSKGWTVGSGSTLDHTLIRKSSIIKGQTDWSAAANEWDTFKTDSTFLNIHTCSCQTVLNFQEEKIKQGIDISISESEKITVKNTKQDFKINKIEIINFMGQLLVQEAKSNVPPEFNINISGLFSGSYILVLKGDNKIYTNRFIKF